MHLKANINPILIGISLLLINLHSWAEDQSAGELDALLGGFSQQHP